MSVIYEKLNSVLGPYAEAIKQNASDISDVNASLLNAFPTDTASGAVASFTDGADNVPTKDLTVEITPVQSGSGDPSPENVRPISGWTGATITRNDGTAGSNEEAVTIDWTSEAGTVYGGSLDVTTGVLTVTHAIVDMGDGDWSYDSSVGRFGSGIIKNIVKAPSVNSDVAGVTCDILPTKASTYSNNSSISYMVSVTSSGWTYARYSDYTDADAFKTAVTGHKIVYPLATPTTVQLTAQEVTTLLGNNNIYADTGNVSVTYRADSALYIEGKAGTSDAYTKTEVDTALGLKADKSDTYTKSEVDAEISALNSSIPDVVAPEDTSFFVQGINLCDPEACVVGEFINQSTGVFATKSLHQRTDYIPVEPNKSYFAVAANNAAVDTRYAFYKSDKTFISGGLILGSGGLQTFTSPANAAYMVASVGTIAYDIMVAQTDEVIPFEPYALYIDKQYINLGSEIVMNVPAKIYAVVGYELNIYFENIAEDWTKHDWNVDCTVGKQMERGYTITPEESDVGTKTLTIKATDEHGNVKTVISSLIITSASAGSGASKSVIILGDSTTNSGIVIEKLNANFSSDVMSVSTLGTRGTAPNLHEGRSGWRLETYFTTEYIDYTDGRGHVENPFYNPTSQTFDASYYFANSGVSVPDFFVVNMGVNDVFSSSNDAALATAIGQFVDYMDAIITSLRTVSQTLKICICCTIPPNHSQDAFGKAYRCNQTRNRCKRNNTMLVDRIIEEYDGRESENIYVIPIHTNLDTVYNMGMETLSVNARNTGITYESPIANGGVHPVESGYWQIADVYTAFLKAQA